MDQLNERSNLTDCVPVKKFKLDFEACETTGPEGNMKICPIEQALANLNDQTACGVSGFNNFLYKCLKVSDVKPFIEYLSLIHI